MTDEG